MSIVEVLRAVLCLRTLFGMPIAQVFTSRASSLICATTWVIIGILSLGLFSVFAIFCCLARPFRVGLGLLSKSSLFFINLYRTLVWEVFIFWF